MQNKRRNAATKAENSGVLVYLFVFHIYVLHIKQKKEDISGIKSKRVHDTSSRFLNKRFKFQLENKSKAITSANKKNE